MPISILLADDHEILRNGLQMVLGTQPDFKVVGQAVNGLEAVALAKRLNPDVAIVDILMPGLNGINVTFQIKQLLPKSRVIILSVHDDESYVMDALRNGADGYVLKASSATDLIQAVRAVVAGEHFLSPSLAERAFQIYVHQGQNKDAGEFNMLTNREHKVFLLYAEGLKSSEIANQLSISVRTVETHRNNLMHKLGLHSQNDLIIYARSHGVIV
jgi:DNA-binding NarL/FixJ family response regulator